MTVLTAMALAIVGFFAYQAAAAPERHTAEPAPAASSPAPGAEEAETELGEEPDEETAPALPADSGQGTRVVYALADRQVWLVDAGSDGLGEEVLHSYPVHPSAVHPLPGEYAVSGRFPETTGSDGVPIEHIVLFASLGETVIGFSSALDGSLPDPDSTERTGGIRQSREDGEAMWEFATIGLPVVVVP